MDRAHQLDEGRGGAVTDLAFGKNWYEDKRVFLTNFSCFNCFYSFLVFALLKNHIEVLKQ